MRLHPLFALAAAPLLLAPVRLDDATPAGLQGLAQSPAPQSYSLPAAAVLATPTVIMVSPTLMPWVNVSPSVSPTVLKRQPQVAANPNAMPQISAEVCVRALATTTDIALQSYREKQQKPTSTLVIAASMAASQASAQEWPTLTAFGNALSALPFNTPLKAEIRTAANASLKLCANPNPAPRKAIPGSRIPVPRPD